MPERRSAIVFQVPFTLRPVADIEPWGKPGDRFLSWFALTDGAYCIETPAGRLLEYALGDPPEHWVTYQVVRLFEGFLEIWPHVAEVVPGDMSARFLAWHGTDAYAQASNGWELDPLDTFDKASWWWQERCLDFSYLSSKPGLYFWRGETEIHLVWDAPDRTEDGPVWAVQRLRLTLPFDVLRDGVAAFWQALLDAMAERVAAIQRDGWTRTDCTLDVAGLLDDQRVRATWPAASLRASRPTDWDLVRRSLDRLGAG